MSAFLGVDASSYPAGDLFLPGKSSFVFFRGEAVGWLCACRASPPAASLTATVCTMLPWFQKTHGPGPPLGNSLNDSSRHCGLLLGAEALCLHAEPAGGGPGAVPPPPPVYLHSKPSLLLPAASPVPSTLLILQSLQREFTQQSLPWEGSVNVKLLGRRRSVPSRLHCQSRYAALLPSAASPPFTGGSKLGSCLVEMLSPLKPGVCCYVLSLHPVSTGQSVWKRSGPENMQV